MRARCARADVQLARVSRELSMLLLALPLWLLATGFLFSPTDPNNGLFDTWLYAQPDAADGVPRYYANYLSACRSASCARAVTPSLRAAQSDEPRLAKTASSSGCASLLLPPPSAEPASAVPLALKLLPSTMVS